MQNTSSSQVRYAIIAVKSKLLEDQSIFKTAQKKSSGLTPIRLIDILEQLKQCKLDLVNDLIRGISLLSFCFFSF